MLAKHGIRFFTFQQKPANVVIVGPGVTHGIINHGININVAVNFGNSDWAENYAYKKHVCPCKEDVSEATEQICSLKNSLRTPEDVTPKERIKTLKKQKRQLRTYIDRNHEEVEKRKRLEEKLKLKDCPTCPRELRHRYYQSGTLW